MKHYHIDFPPFSSDTVEVLTDEEFFSDGDLPANHNYEAVTVGEGGEFATVADLNAYVDAENDRRRER